NMHVKNQVLHKVLDELLTPLDLKYRASENLVIIRRVDRKEEELIKSVIPSTEPILVDRTIRGKVTDENGEGLPGVSIVLKGTQRGTISSSDGGYELVIPDGENILIFSFVGYLTQEVALGNRTTVDIGLEVDQKSLEEVVVVGYGTQKKSDLTGSVTVVDMNQLQKMPATNLGQQLQGRAAGVTVGSQGAPGSPTMIRIRGIGTVNNNGPL